MKNDLLCTANKRIIWLSQTYDGSIHDKKILDEQPLSLPFGTTLWQDTDFIGHKPEKVTIKMPTKKPKGNQLTDIQKMRTRKYQVSVFLSNMLSAESKNVVLSKSDSDVASLDLTI